MSKTYTNHAFSEGAAVEPFWRVLSRNVSDAFRRRRASPGAEAFSPGYYTYIRAADVRARSGSGQVSSLPGFRRTASDGPNPGFAERSESLRAKLLNAYAPIQPVIDRRMFAGRTQILKSLIHAIEDERLHLVLYGERGVGKTSLLQLVSQAARDANYLVAYIDCGQRSEFDDTFRALAACVPLMFHSAYGPTSPESERGDTLASLLTADPITVAGAIESLSKIEGTRVLLILDDFDHSGSDDFRSKVAELLKRLSDHAVHVQALIAGVPAELAELVGQVPSLHRNVLAMRVPRMASTEIREIIAKGQSVSGVRFDDQALQATIAACGGSPYVAKLLSYRAGLAALEAGRGTVNARDVGVSVQDAVDDLRKTVSRYAQLQVEELTRRGQLDALGALARAAQSTGGWFAMQDVTDVLREDPIPRLDARALVGELVQRDVLIEIERDTYGHAFRFVGPTMPDFVSLLVTRSRGFEPEQGERSALIGKGA